MSYLKLLITLGQGDMLFGGIVDLNEQLLQFLCYGDYGVCGKR